MGPVAIGFGALLTCLGALGFGLTGAKTALIPAGFGLVLILLGSLALNDALRKHAMHFAAMVGLIGFAMPAAMAGPKLPTLLRTGEVLRADGSSATFAVVLQLVMAAICGVFLALCVNSFIQARRRRQAAEQQPTT
jgi:hypothetical protein